MSTSSNTYVMFGVKLPYDAFTEEQHESMWLYTDSAYQGIKHHNGLCVVADGMNGEYIFIGRVLAKSVDEDGTGLPVTHCSVDADLRDEVSALLMKHFPISGECDLTVYAFTHYR